jgi:hypothetical protein
VNAEITELFNFSNLLETLRACQLKENDAFTEKYKKSLFGEATVSSILITLKFSNEVLKKMDLLSPSILRKNLQSLLREFCSPKIYPE